MKIDVSKILKGSTESINFKEEVELDEINLDSRTVKLVEPVNLEGGIYYTEEGLYLSGSIEYKYLEFCARCLKEFTNNIKTSFTAKILDDEDKNVDEEDDEFVIYLDGNEIDINNLIINSIFLSLPMKSLCDENCRGLCSKCGKDLNEGHCECETDDIDPRLEKLKKLFD
jgi:uncharacterized protein